MLTRRSEDERIALCQGALLILRTLLFGQEHGQDVARVIQCISENELLVDHGSLYPALQRLEAKGLVVGEWGTSGNNLRARFYRLTPAGKKQLTSKTRQWERITAAVGRVLAAETPTG